MLEVVCGFLDAGKELQRQLLAFLVRLGQVDDFGALRLGHVGVVKACLSIEDRQKKRSK